MKTTKKLLILAGFLIATTTCDKKEDVPVDDTKVEPTPVGTYIGNPSIKTIGSSGGIISSSDGVLDLEFSEGTLSNNTDISIQAVTNNAPGGIGNAYRFGPAGTNLSKPVILKFNYTKKDMAGSSPMFLKMAVQDSDQVWYDLKTYTVDTLNKTISIASNRLFAPGSSKSVKYKNAKAAYNFLDHATFRDLYILPLSAELKPGESKTFQVFAVERHLGNLDEPVDALPPLPTPHEVSANTIRRWTANGVTNGNSQYGTITPNGASCTYKAPDTKPGRSRNPVQLTADINLVYHDPVTGQDFNNLKITSPVTISDGQYSFQLKITFKIESFASGIFYWTISDLVTMDVNVNNKIVTITNVQNNPGSVAPVTQSIPYGPGSCTATWQQEEGSTGFLNITKASGLVFPDPNNRDLNILSLILTNNNAATPRFRLVCTGGGSSISGGDNLGSNDLNYEFLLDDDEIQIDKQDPTTIVTLTPN